MATVEKTQIYEKVPTKELINENDVPVYGYGVRHMQAIILFICMLIGYIARAHLGVTIVAMTNTITQNSKINLTINETIDLIATAELNLNDTNVGYERNGTNFEVGSNMSFSEDSIWNVYRTYDWGKPVQDMILGAFFMGYFVAMFPTGMICQRFGGKLPLQSCLLINGIASLAVPSVAVWGGWKAVFCCRALQGLSQAGLYPCMHTLLAKWVPSNERATLSSFVYSGSFIGTVLAFQMGGVMANTAAGWPGTFWLSGVLCFAAFLMLTIFGAASPADHKKISEREKNHILGMIDDGTVKKTFKAPWMSILKSLALWSTFATHAASGVCFVFLLTQIPTYMHYILGYDVKNSGLLSSLPYMAGAVTNMIYGLFSDFCINRGYHSTRSSRIVCNSVSQLGPAILLVMVCFTHNSGLAVFLLIMAVALFTGVHCGWMLVYMDMSPNFSGTLMATGNTISTISINFLPLLMSKVVTDVYDRGQWHIVIYSIVAAISVSNVFFAIFVSSDRQPWDHVEDQGDLELEKASEPSTLLKKG